MSGTSLIILAYSSTLNIVGPGGSHLSADAITNLLILLSIAAALTLGALVIEGSNTQKRAPVARKPVSLKRTFEGPRQRRV